MWRISDLIYVLIVIISLYYLFTSESNFSEKYPGTAQTHIKILEQVSGNRFPDQVMVYEDGTMESAYLVDLETDSEEDVKKLDKEIINEEMNNMDPEASVFLMDLKTDKQLDPDDEAILEEAPPESFKSLKFKDVFKHIAPEMFFEKKIVYSIVNDHNETTWRDFLK
jgi:hypothetical protein